MFNLPEAKRVRRSDLASTPPSSERSSPAPDLEASLQQRLASIYGPISSEQHTTDLEVEIPVTAGPDEDEEDEFEFRLFATPGKPTTAVRVRVRSPTPAHGEPGFVQPRRSDGYYFTGSNNEKAEQYRDAAVTGEELVKGLRVRWPGCELPWKVTSIKVINAGKDKFVATMSNGGGQKRKKDGKKRRIIKRKKLVAIQEQKQSAKQSQAEKETAEREKRTRRNREKKVKKKQKEKLKKVEQTETPG